MAYQRYGGVLEWEGDASTLAFPPLPPAVAKRREHAPLYPSALAITAVFFALIFLVVSCFRRLSGLSVGRYSGRQLANGEGPPTGGGNECGEGGPGDGNGSNSPSDQQSQHGTGPVDAAQSEDATITNTQHGGAADEVPLNWQPEHWGPPAQGAPVSEPEQSWIQHFDKWLNLETGTGEGQDSTPGPPIEKQEIALPEGSMSPFLHDPPTLPALEELTFSPLALGEQGTLGEGVEPAPSGSEEQQTLAEGLLYREWSLTGAAQNVDRAITHLFTLNTLVLKALKEVEQRKSSFSQGDAEGNHPQNQEAASSEGLPQIPGGNLQEHLNNASTRLANLTELVQTALQTLEEELGLSTAGIAYENLKYSAQALVAQVTVGETLLGHVQSQGGGSVVDGMKQAVENAKLVQETAESYIQAFGGGFAEADTATNQHMFKLGAKFLKKWKDFLDGARGAVNAAEGDSKPWDGYWLKIVLTSANSLFDAVNGAVGPLEQQAAHSDLAEWKTARTDFQNSAALAKQGSGQEGQPSGSDDNWLPYLKHLALLWNCQNVLISSTDESVQGHVPHLRVYHPALYEEYLMHRNQVLLTGSRRVDPVLVEAAQFLGADVPQQRHPSEGFPPGVSLILRIAEVKTNLKYVLDSAGGVPTKEQQAWVVYFGQEVEALEQQVNVHVATGLLGPGSPLEADVIAALLELEEFCENNGVQLKPPQPPLGPGPPGPPGGPPGPKPPGPSGAPSQTPAGDSQGAGAPPETPSPAYDRSYIEKCKENLFTLEGLIMAALENPADVEPLEKHPVIVELTAQLNKLAEILGRGDLTQEERNELIQISKEALEKAKLANEISKAAKVEKKQPKKTTPVALPAAGPSSPSPGPSGAQPTAGAPTGPSPSGTQPVAGPSAGAGAVASPSGTPAGQTGPTGATAAPEENSETPEEVVENGSLALAVLLSLSDSVENPPESDLVAAAETGIKYLELAGDLIKDPNVQEGVKQQLEDLCAELIPALQAIKGMSNYLYPGTGS